MADVGDRQPSRLTPEGIGALVMQLLQLADMVLKLFGRRKTDRPDRQGPEQ